MGDADVAGAPHDRRDSCPLVEAGLGAVGDHADRRVAAQQGPHQVDGRRIPVPFEAVDLAHDLGLDGGLRVHGAHLGQQAGLDLSHAGLDEPGVAALHRPHLPLERALPGDRAAGKSPGHDADVGGGVGGFEATVGGCTGGQVFGQAQQSTDPAGGMVHGVHGLGRA